MASTRDRALPFVALFGVLALAGCPAEEQGATNGNNQDTGTSSAEQTDEGELEPGPGRGISILEVEINQGTRVPVGIEGEWVDGPERNGFLIASRDTLMRIHYTVEEGFEPREMQARLTLRFADGTEKTLTDQRLVENDSNRKNFNGPFRFGLIADEGETLTGTQYQVELWEVSGGAGEGYDEGIWVNPEVGFRLIGFEQIDMQIKTQLVPITYNGTTANLDEATTETVLNNLYEQNPATEILYEVHAPYVYEGQLSELGQLLPVMSNLHAVEQAPPNVYYHALVNVGSQALGSTLGISYLTNDNKTDGDRRVSATVLWEPNPSIAADTYTHETGHAQGLSHVECPNRDSANPNPNYPYENGRIGNWGFGIRRFLMYDPDDAFDYMSYCSPSWVSDWTWNLTYQRIKTLTTWDFEGAPASPGVEKDILMGAVYPDGHREWWTIRGDIDAERVSGLDRVEFELDTGERVESYAEVSTLSNGEIYWVAVPLPTSRDHIQAITHTHGDEVQAVSLPGIDAQLNLDSANPNWKPSWKVLRR